MKKLIPVIGLAAIALAATAATAVGRAHSSKGSADICVLLPDTKSSVRWETADRPFLDKAFKAAGISHTIVTYAIIRIRPGYCERDSPSGLAELTFESNQNRS